MRRRTYVNQTQHWAPHRGTDAHAHAEREKKKRRQIRVPRSGEAAIVHRTARRRRAQGRILGGALLRARVCRPRQPPPASSLPLPHGAAAAVKCRSARVHPSLLRSSARRRLDPLPPPCHGGERKATEASAGEERKQDGTATHVAEEGEGRGGMSSRHEEKNARSSQSGGGGGGGGGGISRGQGEDTEPAVTTRGGANWGGWAPLSPRHGACTAFRAAQTRTRTPLLKSAPHHVHAHTHTHEHPIAQCNAPGSRKPKEKYCKRRGRGAAHAHDCATTSPAVAGCSPGIPIKTTCRPPPPRGPMPA